MKKKRTDSNDFQRGAVAVEDILPPSHCCVPDDALPFWHDIIRTKSHDLWTDVDLMHAANLAVVYYQIAQNRMELLDEGPVIFNDRGTPIPNPRQRVISELTSQSVQLSRILQVHSQATNGDSKDLKERNTKARKAGDAVRAIEEDDVDSMLLGARH